MAEVDPSTMQLTGLVNRKASDAGIMKVIWGLAAGIVTLLMHAFIAKVTYAKHWFRTGK